MKKISLHASKLLCSVPKIPLSSLDFLSIEFPNCPINEAISTFTQYLLDCRDTGVKEAVDAMCLGISVSFSDLVRTAFSKMSIAMGL